MITYDSVSFKLGMDEAAQAAVIEYVTKSGEQIAVGMSGEAFERLARMILTVLDQYPQIREWKTIPPQ